MHPHSNDSFQQLDSDPAITVQFQQAATKYHHFLHSLNSSLKTLLSFCDWRIVSSGDTIELAIYCPSGNVRTRLLQRLWAIALRANRLFGPAKIRILADGYAFETTTTQVINYYRYWYCSGSDRSK
jgi:hypothetical protein